MGVVTKSRKPNIKSAIKLGPSRQVVIPKSIYDNMRLAPGDYVEVAQQGKTLVLTPRPAAVSKRSTLDKDLVEALEDVRAGRMSGPFKTVGELTRHLESVKR